TRMKHLFGNPKLLRSFRVMVDMRIGLNLKLNVVQYAVMNSMDQEIGPESPIGLGCHFDFVPRATFKARLTSRKIDVTEFSTA
ncbi:MAG: hypothetical protein WB795_19905, partial [Candidatus Acidiferrales bacterium]